jgi:hypothetical protein
MNVLGIDLCRDTGYRAMALKINVNIVLRLRHDRFLPYPFQFII